MDILPSPLPDRDVSGARRRYVEFYAEAIVQNHYLKVTALILAVSIVALLVLNFRSQALLSGFKPLVLRIDAAGRTQAVAYTDLEYHPQAPEIRYFLTDFVARYYGRMRATFRDSYARSLYYLDAPLAEEAMAEQKKSPTFESFLAGFGDEVDIQVLNVVLEDLRTPPYKASVDFEKQVYGPGRTPMRRERWVANVVFLFRDHVPNDLIPINPLGLTITYIREDQAFK